MDRTEILKRINDTFIDILENDGIVLTDETTENDVEDWDSLNHVHLVVAIEKQFNIRFNTTEFESWNNVGDIVNSINSKLN